MQVWLAAALGFAVAAVYGVMSAGTYQDDDLDHYYTAVRAWNHPELFIDPWAMPALTLLLAVPGKLFGYLGVEITTALVTGVTVLAVGMTARAIKLPHPWFAALLFFFQPLVLELSYSALAEPLGAAFLALGMWAWYTNRFDRSLMLLGWMPLARVETAWIPAAALLLTWRKTSWVGRIGAAAPLAAWAVIGFLYSGEPLYILGGEGTRPLNGLGVLHYAKNLIVISGPVILVGLVWALVSGRTAGRRFPQAALVLCGVHLLLLSLLAWEALPLGRSIGFLRHALVVFPCLAVTAAYGFEAWSRGEARSKMLTVLAAVGWAAVVYGWYSHVLESHSFVREGRVEFRWMATAVLVGTGLLVLWTKKVPRSWVLLVGAVLLAAGLTLKTTRPKDLDIERQAMARVIEYIDTYCVAVNVDCDSQIVYTNHPWFAFLTGRDRYNHQVTPLLTLENLDSAPSGALVIWENHYGNRLWGNVPDEFLRQNQEYERMLELSADPFVFVLFRKL